MLSTLLSTGAVSLSNTEPVVKRVDNTDSLYFAGCSIHAVLSLWCRSGRAQTVPRPPSIRAGSRPVTTSCMRPVAPATPARNAPHLEIGLLIDPGSKRAHSTTGNYTNSRQCFCRSRRLVDQATFKRAPSGTTPDSTNRHKSISRRRASATMPMRRWRLLPPPKRSVNHRLCLLVG